MILCSTSTLREMSSLVRQCSAPLTYSESGRCSNPPSPGDPRQGRRPPRALSETARHGVGAIGAVRGRLVSFLAMVALLVGAMTTGSFTSATRWVSEQITEMVIKDPPAPPVDETKTTKGKRSKTADRLESR